MARFNPQIVREQQLGARLSRRQNRNVSATQTARVQTGQPAGVQEQRTKYQERINTINQEIQTMGNRERRDLLKERERLEQAKNDLALLETNLLANPEYGAKGSEQKQIIKAFNPGIRTSGITQKLAPSKVRDKERRVQALEEKGLSLQEIRALSPSQQRARLQETTQTASVSVPLGSIGAGESTSFTGSLPRAPTGVYAGGKGEQVIVTEGKRAKTAGELLSRLQNAQVIEPAFVKRSAALESKVLGTTKDGKVRTSKRAPLQVTIGATSFFTREFSLTPPKEQRAPQQKETTPAFSLTGANLQFITNNINNNVRRQDDKLFAQVSQRIERQQKREKEFFESKALGRSRRVGEVIGLGYIALNPFAPKQERQVAKSAIFRGTDPSTFATRSAALAGGGLTSAPITIGGSFFSGVEKVSATADVLRLRGAKERVQQEYKRAGKQTIATTFNPTTPEGFVTYASAFTFGGLRAGSQFYSVRTTPIANNQLRITSTRKTTGTGTGSTLPILRNPTTRITYTSRPRGLVRRIVYKEAKTNIKVTPEGLQTTKVALTPRFFGKTRIVTRQSQARLGKPLQVTGERAVAQRRETQQVTDKSVAQAVGASRILQVRGTFDGFPIEGELAQRSVSTTRSTIGKSTSQATLQTLLVRKDASAALFAGKDLLRRRGEGKAQLRIGNAYNEYLRSQNKLREGFTAQEQIGNTIFLEKQLFSGVARVPRARSRLRVDVSERGVFTFQQKKPILPRSRRGQLGLDSELRAQRASVSLRETKARGFSEQVRLPRSISSLRSPIVLITPTLLQETPQISRVEPISISQTRTRQLPNTIARSTTIPSTVTIPDVTTQQVQQPRLRQRTVQTPQLVSPTFFQQSTTRTPPIPPVVGIPFVLPFGGSVRDDEKKEDRRGVSRSYRPSRTLFEVTFSKNLGRQAKSVRGGFTGLELTRSFSVERRRKKRRK